MSEMLQFALQYHDEGLCVIPVRPRQKMPALTSWEVYQTRTSTRREVEHWFTNTSFNIGIVHGEVSNNFITLDVDHDNGLWDLLNSQHPHLLTGRLERSGGGAGYHIPLFLERLPDFGFNSKQERPRGNKTWKTENGHINVRARFCQSVAPNSVHPSGGRYIFIQDGPIARVESLDLLIAWLNRLAPPPPPKRITGPRRNRPHDATGTLLEAVRSAWSTLDIFDHFGLAFDVRKERNGETRLGGNGGLLITEGGEWYNFSDEYGGHIIEAWGWCRFGSAFNKRTQFRQVLLEMARGAGIDTARYHKRGDERVVQVDEGDRAYWSNNCRVWEKMR